MALAYKSPRDVKTIVLTELLGTQRALSVADGKQVIIVPCNLDVFQVDMYLGNTGNVGLNNDVTVWYTPPADAHTVAGLDAAADLWIVAGQLGTFGQVGRIPGAAALQYAEWNRAHLARSRIRVGGTLSLNVDAVAAGTPGNLVVQLFCYPLDD